VSIAVTVYAVKYAHDLAESDKKARLDVRTTYAAEEAGIWAMIVSISNRGPGVASRLQIIYNGINTACFVFAVTPKGEETDVKTKQSKSNAECKDGVSLTEVRKGSPESMTFLFPREVTGESKAFAVNSYSATCPELYPGEVIWLEFVFRAEKGLDTRLRASLPIDETAKTDAGPIMRFFDKFSGVSVNGTYISHGRKEFSAIQRL
jgi:hypothetical protein